MNKINLSMTIIVSVLIGALIGAQVAHWERGRDPEGSMARALEGATYGIVVDHPDDEIEAACAETRDCMDVFLLDQVSTREVRGQ